MIRVTVELVPHGVEKEKKVISEMLLANSLKGTPEKGSYEAIISEDNWTGEDQRHFMVSGFDRRKGVWDLIKLILNTKEHAGKKSNLYARLQNKLKEYK